MSSSKTTVKVSAIKVYEVLRAYEDRLNAVGAHAEAALVREQKLLVLKNIGEVSDRKHTPANGTFLAKQPSVIDWGGF